MKEFTATTTIHASAEKVWDILTDGANWPAWDPFCDRIEGNIALGAKITAFTKLAPGRGFPVKVSELVPGAKMTWTGGMPLGLFKGVRTFTAKPADGGAIEFTVHEVFSGLLAGLIPVPDLQKPFEQFAAGLKARAEGASAA